MVLYLKHLSNPWFEYILYGQKTIEGRLVKGDFADMKSGDEITFFNKDTFYRQVNVKITRVEYYPSFEVLLSRENIQDVLPGTSSVEAGVAVYRRFFSVEEEENCGVVALHIRKI